MISYLYLLRFRTRIKIGISWNLNNRVSQIDRTTRGNQRLILAVIIPFKARQIEAWLHRRYKRYHAPLKAGSGRSEYFYVGLWVLECIFLYLVISIAQWLVCLALFYSILLALLTVFY